MRLRRGDMFEHALEYDIMFVTTNAFIRSDGRLVMGRGAAYQAAQRMPALPMVLAAIIKRSINPRQYGLAIPQPSEQWGTITGAFQVKDHWRDDADLRLIQFSVDDLKTLGELLPTWRIALNFPGIGNGRLSREDVLPIIEELPNNIEVWER